MWLARPLYELLPYIYALGGALGLLAGSRLAPGIAATVCFALGWGALLIGIVLFLRRRGYRRSSARIEGETGE